MTYLGEDDLRGYRMVINRCLLIVIVCMGIISLAMGLSPELMLSCFGADEHLIPYLSGGYALSIMTVGVSW